MGGTKPWPELPVDNKEYTSATVVIIGAGISGMCTAIDLLKRNKCRNFIIVEKSSGVGGTWHDNKYPGCCCDVWSLLYSYSFEQNPNWSRAYPGQEEIHDYLIGVAEKYGLYKHIRFNTSVEEAKWDDVESKWKTKVRVSGSKDSEFSDGYTITSDYLVSAVGQLNSPKYPPIPGLDSFKGKKMHSARWDWSYKLDGKRVALIGNGATAVQILPEIQKVASHVTVYQRTPNWVIPRLDGPTSDLKRLVFKYIPPVMQRIRAMQMDFRESFYDAVTDANSPLAEEIRRSCLEQMHAALPDQPELWEKLTPNYNPGCKRVIISDDYYPCLAQPNISLETRPISHIDETGVTVSTPDGGEAHEDFDLVVCATGFRTVEFMHPIKITGAHGRELSDIWRGGARAYYGITVEDIPNFGMLYGPNTNLGHNSIILMIEAQSRYINAQIGAVLDAKRRGESLVLRPKPEVVEAYNREVQERLEKSSFADPKCNSWYKNEEGRITNNWSGTVIEYQKRLASVNWDDYIAEGSAAQDVRAKKETRLGRVVEETQVSNTTMLLSALSVMAVVGGYLARNSHVVTSRLRAR